MNLRLSICIPQYNRIEFLLASLNEIQKQKYENLEIIISDDCSEDNTWKEINKLKEIYKYQIHYYRNDINLGYDRNLRKSLELATGDYLMILGNDDTICCKYDMKDLMRFVESNNYPDVGFVNFKSALSGQVENRAKNTAVLGSGPEVAFKYYSCFSFVGGVVFKRSTFQRYNTGKTDGSIYSQIYHACLMIASGAVLFSIKDPVVIKDILPERRGRRKSYVDFIARTWSKYRRTDGGLKSVIHVLMKAFEDTNTLTGRMAYKVFRKVYLTTFPYWIVDYRINGAFPAAVGLVDGMRPWQHEDINKLHFYSKARIYALYFVSALAGLLTPIFVYDFFVSKVYRK